MNEDQIIEKLWHVMEIAEIYERMHMMKICENLPKRNQKCRTMKKIENDEMSLNDEQWSSSDGLENRPGGWGGAASLICKQNDLKNHTLLQTG